MSDTPRTNKQLCSIAYVGAPTLYYVHADFARELERELNRAMRVVEAAKELAANCEEYEFDDGLGYAAQGMWWHDLDNALEEWEAGR